MKKSYIALLTILTSMSLSHASVLECTGKGIVEKVAIDSTEIVIQKTDESKVNFISFESLKAISTGKDATAVFIKELGSESQGEILNAGMLRVSGKGKKAAISFDGSVILLDCKVVKKSDLLDNK